MISLISESVPFSRLSNFLCHFAVCLLPAFGKVWLSDTNSLQKCNASLILADYCLDLCLLQRDVTLNAVGSVQSGLSLDRVARLTAISKQLVLPHVQRIKKEIIDLLPLNIFPSALSVAISIICSVDTDKTVSTQSTFKMNGAMEIFAVTSSAADVVCSLLSLCCGSSAEHQSLSCSNRSALTVEMQCALLSWVSKHLQPHLHFGNNQILAIACKNISVTGLNTIFSSSIRVVALSLKLLMEACQATDCTTTTVWMKQSSSMLIGLSHAVLISFLSSSSSSSLMAEDSENNLLIRRSCYAIISAVANQHGEYIVEQHTLLQTLFRLLDKEDDRIASEMHAALYHLKGAYQSSFSLLSSSKGLSVCL
jgi:hypothetical protein